LAKKLLALREDLRFGLDVSFYKLRQILIAIQNSEELSIYNLNDDWIFFLNLNELREVLINPESLTGYLQTLNDRITLYNDEKDKSPAYYLKIDGENIIDLDKKSDNMHSFHGIAASPGIIEGKVKIIRGESDFSKLNKGEVLIAYNTDPGWTPLFLLAKGVVVEMGGLLNHCAIVAREYGIPAVVGVKHITQLLTDGQLVRINGHTGNVEVLSEN